MHTEGGSGDRRHVNIGFTDNVPGNMVCDGLGEEVATKSGSAQTGVGNGADVGQMCR